MTILIVFILSTFGLTQIVVNSQIMSPLRTFCEEWFPNTLGKIVNCSMCFGFWAGVLMALCEYLQINGHPLGINLVSCFWSGCLASGTSFFLDTVVSWMLVQVSSSKNQAMTQMVNQIYGSAWGKEAPDWSGE